MSSPLRGVNNLPHFGTIVSLNIDQGSGVISTGNSQENSHIPFDVSELRVDCRYVKDVIRGMQVEFSLKQDEDGKRQAIRVIPLDVMNFDGKVAHISRLDTLVEVAVEGLATPIAFCRTHLDAQSKNSRIQIGDRVKIEIGFHNFVSARKPPRANRVTLMQPRQTEEIRLRPALRRSNSDLNVEDQRYDQRNEMNGISSGMNVPGGLRSRARSHESQFRHGMPQPPPPGIHSPSGYPQYYSHPGMWTHSPGMNIYPAPPPPPSSGPSLHSFSSPPPPPPPCPMAHRAAAAAAAASYINPNSSGTPEWMAYGKTAYAATPAPQTPQHFDPNKLHARLQGGFGPSDDSNVTIEMTVHQLKDLMRYGTLSTNDGC